MAEARGALAGKQTDDRMNRKRRKTRMAAIPPWRGGLSFIRGIHTLSLVPVPHRYRRFGGIRDPFALRVFMAFDLEILK